MKTLRNTIKSMKELIKELEAKEDKTLGDYKVIDKYKDTLKELESKLDDPVFVLIDTINQYYVTKETSDKLNDKKTYMLYDAMHNYAGQLSKFFNENGFDDFQTKEFFNKMSREISELTVWCLYTLEELNTFEKAVSSINDWDYYIDFVMTEFTPAFLKYLWDNKNGEGVTAISAIEAGTFFLDKLKEYINRTYNNRDEKKSSND